MAGAQLDNKQEIQQINYGTLVNFAINVKTRVLNLMDTSPRLFDGSEIRENIGYAMPAGGISSGPSTAVVPPASTSLNAETFIYQTYHYDTIAIDWDAADQTSGRHSYISAVQQELVRVSQFRPREMERQVMSDGSGYMAEVLTVTQDDATALIFTVSNANAIKFLINTPLEFWNWSTNTGGSDADKIDTGTPSPPPATQAPPIVSNVVLGATSATITCSAGGTTGGVNTAVTTNGDTVYTARWLSITEGGGPSNGTNPTNLSNEMNGLDILISDQNELLVKNTASGSGFANYDTFQNIGRTGNSWWQSSTFDANGAKLSASLVDRVANQIATWGAMSPDEIEYIIASYDSITDALQGLYPGERYPHTNNAGALDFSSGSTTTFDVNYGPKIGERMTVKSEFTAPGKAYLMGPGMLHYNLKPWGFWTGSGSMWRLPRDGRPAQEGNAYCIKAVGATKPNCSGVLTDLG